MLRIFLALFLLASASLEAIPIVSGFVRLDGFQGTWGVTASNGTSAGGQLQAFVPCVEIDECRPGEQWNFSFHTEWPLMSVSVGGAFTGPGTSMDLTTAGLTLTQSLVYNLPFSGGISVEALDLLTGDCVLCEFFDGRGRATLNFHRVETGDLLRPILILDRIEYRFSPIPEPGSFLLVLGAACVFVLSRLGHQRS